MLWDDGGLFENYKTDFKFYCGGEINKRIVGKLRLLPGANPSSSHGLLHHITFKLRNLMAILLLFWGNSICLCIKSNSIIDCYIDFVLRVWTGISSFWNVCSYFFNYYFNNM